MENNSDLDIGRSAPMEGDKFRTRTKKMKRRYSNITPALFRMTGSVITMMLLLLTTFCGFRLTMEPWRYHAIETRAFHVGISTIIFRFLALILGLSILADILLNISEQLPGQCGMNQGQQEMRTMWQGLMLIIITRIVIVWGMYTGFRLATESGESKQYLLTVSIGVTTILFDSIYFIIGLAVVQELVLDLLIRS